MSEYVRPDADGTGGTNRSATPTRCELCGGDRYVTVRLRAPEQTAWMRQHGLKPSTVSFHEETAPCPDCHPVEITHWRFDGSLFKTMDAGAARHLLAQ